MKNKIFPDLKSYEAKLDELSQNPKIKVSAFGKSIMNNELKKIEIGSGEKKIVVLGGAYGNAEESFCLVSFVEEYIKMCDEAKRMCGTNPRYVMSYRSMVIYPLLNPDAFVYRSEGVSKENPIRDRLIDMNGGNDSFCNWSSNGRGVSLERNSSIGFERRKKYENSNDIFNGSPEMFSGNMPESEPELCALFDDILKYQNVKVFLQIAQGKNLLYSPGICEKIPGGSRIVKSVQRISGLKRKNEEIVESGIVDSIAVRFGIRSLKVISEQVDLKYMRDILYSLPILV